MTSDIEKIQIDEKTLIRSSRNKNNRDRSITDILKKNSFKIEGLDSPYNLNIGVTENKISIKANDSVDFLIPLTPLRRIIKDYAIICESYFSAVKTLEPSKVEAIDMGRRGLHDEGAEILQDLLDKKISLDFHTARNFFSLFFSLLEK